MYAVRLLDIVVCIIERGFSISFIFLEHKSVIESE